MDTGAAVHITRVLLTGPPGIGKTTICKKISSELAKQDSKFDGFYTEEVRNENNCRIGFDVVHLKNPEKRLPLARSESVLNQGQKTKFKVGNYHVFLTDFEAIALPTLDSHTKILIIDEIGKMELFSRLFQEKIEKLFFGGSRDVRIIATIPEMQKVPQRHLSLFQKLHADKKSMVINVTRENRDSLANEVVRIITESNC